MGVELHSLWERNAHEVENTFKNFPDIVDGPDADTFYVFILLRQNRIFVVVGVELLAEIESEFS